MDKIKAQVIIGVTIMVVFAAILISFIFKENIPKPVTHYDVLVKGVCVDVIENNVTNSHNYYKCRVVEVLSDSVELKHILHGTYFFLNIRDDFYEKDDEVTYEISIPL